MPFQRSVAWPMLHLAAPVHVLQMRQNFEDREMVIDGRKLSPPQLRDHLMRRLRSPADQIPNFVAALAVMDGGFLNPGAMPGEGLVMAGQDEIDIQRSEAIIRHEEFVQHVAVGMPGNIRRDFLQDLIAGEKHLVLARVEANVAG